MTPEELHDVLDAAGRQPVAPPDPAFVRRLEDRLVSTRVVNGTGGRRPPWRAIGAVAAAVAILAAVMVLQPGEQEQTVVTDPTTTSTSSTTTSTTSTSTTVTTVVTTTSVVVTTTVAPPITTTSASPPPTTTTTTAPPTTTTTAAPGVEDMRLSCVTGPRPEVTCTWAKNEHPDFKGYRLSKRVGDGPVVEVGSTTDRAVTSKTDKDVQAGTRITYVIEALDHDQQVVARGEVTVACC